MADGQEPLLTGSGTGRSGAVGVHILPSCRWARVAAVFIGSGVLVLLSYSESKPSEPHVIFDQNGTSLWGEGLKYNDPRCMQNTKGSCWFGKCDASRGPTDCTWFGWWTCMCQEGYCATETGTCLRLPTSIDTHQTFVLRNVQWPDYHIRVAGDNSVYVTNSPVDARSKFRLLQVPAAQGARPTMFMMASEVTPDWLMETDKDNICETKCDTYGINVTDGTTICTHSTRECKMAYQVKSKYIEKPLSTQKLMIFEANYEKPAMVIEGATTPNHCWYIPRFSWTLGVTSDPGDPGPQGYWTADPPLPKEFLQPPKM